MAAPGCEHAPVTVPELHALQLRVQDAVLAVARRRASARTAVAAATRSRLAAHRLAETESTPPAPAGAAVVTPPSDAALEAAVVQLAAVGKDLPTLTRRAEAAAAAAARRADRAAAVATA